MHRHPLDLISLVFGLVFTSIGLLVFAGPSPVGPTLLRLWPLGLMLGGLLLLAGAVRRGRRGSGS